MLNKAMNLMDQRKAMIDEARQVLAVLGAEEAPIAPIVINKGHIKEIQVIKEVETTNDELIEELQMQLDIAKEELNYYHDVEKDYNNDIKLFKEENAKLIDENIELEGQIAFKDGQILGLNNQIKELEAKIEELTNAKLDNIVKKHVEGDGAMEQPKTQPKKNNSPLQEKLAKVIKDKEERQKKNIAKETLKTEESAASINWTQDVFDKKVNSYSSMMMGIHGDITINNKSYKFKARRAYMPIIYGCFSEEIAEIAREEMKKISRFNITDERTNDDPNFKYAQDKEYPIVVWRLTDDNTVKYHGYTKDKANKLVALAWAPDKMDKENCVGRALVNNLFTDKENWKSLRDNKELADKFMAVCADIWPEDFTNESEDTNEIVVDCTNDATAGCDDLDI